jgi:cell division septal protein FtsQ
MMQRWTIRYFITFLICSTIATLCITLGSYYLISSFGKKRLLDSDYKITRIVQTGLEKEALQTAYLAELLSLSKDAPTPLYGFDPARAADLLLDSPCIAKAYVKRAPPDAIYIDYEVRKPIAWLADYQNIGIDQEGYIFPMIPFLSPKELPELYLGLPLFGKPEDAEGRSGGSWGHPLEGRFLKLGKEILEYLKDVPWKEGFRLKRIDLSNAFAPTLGQREIILFTEESFSLKRGEAEIVSIFPKILRLPTRDYQRQLENFFLLRKSMAGDYQKQLGFLSESTQFAPRIVDLRIPHLAFIDNR